MSTKIAMLLGALAVAGLASAASSSPADEGRLRVSMDARELFVPGEKFGVAIELTAVGGDVELEAWRLSPAILSLDGKPLLPRSNGSSITLAQDDVISMSFEVGARIDKTSDFALGCDGSGEEALSVTVLEKAGAELDFMTLPVEDLGKYRVYMRTNQGDMLHEMWPHLAPNHVRNFLDLSHTGFYDGVIFHRTGRGFMIQGGDPTGTGRGSGPRNVDAEFSKEAHVRGVLSMARGPGPNSASSQFFVMHGSSPSLDGKYSIFGKMMIGYDALEAIVTAPGQASPRDGTVRPTQDQVIERAIVVLAK